MKGGTLGTDYTYESGVVTILTSEPLTLQNENISTAVSTRVMVPAGVSANVTFAGVNMKSTSGGSPFALTPLASGGASAHITLADGTINTLVSGVNGYPGLRCGKGSSVTIDDGVLNQDTEGNAVEPELGRISRDATLANGTEVKEGDALTKMDSKNPGKLTVTGASYAAGLGGGDSEDGGNITINGGIIVASSGSRTTDNAINAGAGIGGGNRAAGGNIVINGGDITATGAFHGAGIGGGWSNSSKHVTVSPTALTTDGLGKSGNITINGGYSRAYGGNHGNAFGDGCDAANKSATKIFEVRVTGGTILAEPGTSGYALGGSSAHVIVLGGSMKADKFQSKDSNKAFGNEERTTEVFQTKLTLASFGLAEAANALVNSLDMKIANVDYEYGMPSYTDESGYLYLWLPNSGAGKEISVDADVIGKTSQESLKTDTFFITNATSGSIMKQYIDFEIDEDAIPLEALSGHYNGEGLDVARIKEVLAAMDDGQGIPVSIPEGGHLTDMSKITIQVRQLLEDGVTIRPNAEIVDAAQAGGGKLELIITSTEYGTVAAYKDEYYGHRTYYKYAEITPADTEATVSVSGQHADSSYVSAKLPLTLTGTVAPTKEEAAACASPTGTVQFYVNGQKCGEPVALVAASGLNTNGRHYSTATLTTTWKEMGIKAGDEIKVTMEYLGDDPNYSYSEGDEKTTASVSDDTQLVAGEDPVIIGKTVDSLTIKGCPNTTYVVTTTSDNKKVTEITTDENGRYTISGLTSGTEYKIAHEIYGDTTGKTVTEDVKQELEDIFDGKGDITVGDDGNYKIEIKEDIEGPLELPDNLGDITIDLGGNTIKGSDATEDTPAQPGIIIKKDDTSDSGESEGTRIEITDSVGGGSIEGGKGSEENPDGANGIETGTGENEPDNSGVIIGGGVTVSGGAGATDEDGNGGNGGNGITGSVDVNVSGGTVTGGEGGNGAAKKDEDGGAGGNGGSGIVTGDKDVNVSGGTVTGGAGGNGGSSDLKDGGAAGNGGGSGLDEENDNVNITDPDAVKDGTNGDEGSDIESKLEDIFGDKAEIKKDEDGNIKIEIKEDITGPIELPDSVGDITIDLGGNTIKGTDATEDTPAQPGIIIKKDDTTTDPEGNQGAKVEIVDTIGGGSIEGGNGSSEHPDGADGIVTGKEDEKPGNSGITIGDGVNVSGGDGTTGSDGNGGNGGNGVSGNVDVNVNGGTVSGGNGGNGADKKEENGGNGGNGGSAIKTDDTKVNVSGGNVSGGSGGNGGSSEEKEGGTAGEGGAAVNPGKGEVTITDPDAVVEGESGADGENNSDDGNKDEAGNNEDDDDKNHDDENNDDENNDDKNDNDNENNDDEIKDDDESGNLNGEEENSDKDHNNDEDTNLGNDDQNAADDEEKESDEAIDAEKDKESSAVNTGDHNNVMLLVAMLLASAIVVAVLAKKRKQA